LTTGLLLLGFVLSAGGTGADEHLLAGAGFFREGRFTEALVEFRVAGRLGAPEASAYAGAALVKLDRPEEAIEAFGGVDAPGRDAVLDYYRALAAFEARLYVAADRLLAAVADRSGPRIGSQAAALRARIAPVLAKEPERAAIDWYRARCAVLKEEGRTVLASAYCAEATSLAERRADRHGLGSADAGGAPPPGAGGGRP
jgi:tetratricopeptide (TPR) repeat protein